MHTPALQTGTHFLLTLETIVFLFLLLGATSKPFSSLSTRLLRSAFRVLFTKSRSVDSLLMLLFDADRRQHQTECVNNVTSKSSGRSILTTCTLGVVAVGPRCRLLASAGKVSATQAINPKLDNLWTDDRDRFLKVRKSPVRL